MVSASSYSALARDLAKFRPTSGIEATADCIAAVSDTSPLTVAWVDRVGRRTTVTVQSGCSGGPGYKLVQVLRTVPRRLGVAEWSRQMTRAGATRG